MRVDREIGCCSEEECLAQLIVGTRAEEKFAGFVNHFLCHCVLGRSLAQQNHLVVELGSAVGQILVSLVDGVFNVHFQSLLEELVALA